jgi:hypothetical protein
MIHNIVEGTTLTATAEFLDDDDNPLQNKPGYPRIRLYDVDNSIILETTANFVSLGNFTADIQVPLLGYDKKQQLRLVWVFRDVDDHKYKTTDVVIVEPATLKRDSDLFTISGLDTNTTFVLPESVVPTDGKLNIFRENFVLDTRLLSTAQLDSNGVDRTGVTFNLPTTVTPSLNNYLVICTLTRPGTIVPKNYTYKLWHVTPSVVSMISLIEDFVNKSKIENVIPELEYTHADIMSSLIQGLSHFNGIGPQLTSFNGLNMQGAIGNAWFICSCWYLINAQKMAEGSLAFDFSGQGVSLNVDRTPALDAMLSSLESRIQDTVVPLKKLLAKAGIVSGDGSSGNNLNGLVDSRAAARRMGHLTVTNSPTTSFNSGIKWRQR